MTDKISASITDRFFDEGDAWLVRYSALEPNSPHDRDAAQLVRGIGIWLAACVQAGQFLPPGSPQRRALRAFLDEWNSRLRRNGHLLRGLERLREFDPTAGVPLDVGCPYPGLDAYRENRASGFFGRAALVEEYTRKLLAERILLIVGGSGSGKSSIAMAGIRYRFVGDGAGKPPEFPGWCAPEVFTPGASPLRALATAVARLSGPDADGSALHHKLREGTEAASAELRSRCNGQPLLLVVDQFEEILTLCRDPEERKAFGILLARLTAKTGDWPCHVLLTMRTDYLGRFEKDDGLKPLYASVIDGKNFEHLPALDFDSIRKAITEPAEAIGLRFVPAEIPDRLASETAGLANGLPLLQFALQRLWETRLREGDLPESQPLDLITLQQVNDLPDVQRALGHTANEIYESLTVNQRAICQRLMQELVVLDENFDEPLRRRRAHAELKDALHPGFPGDQNQKDLAQVESKFIDAGLLRVFFRETDHEQIEVTHEALLRHWKVIRQVVSGDEAKQRLQAIKQIGREAMEWHVSGKTEDHLKQHGQPLAFAIKYLEDGWFADRESRQYLAACSEFERRRRSRTFILRTVAGAASVLVAVAVAALSFQWTAARANLKSLASLSSRLPAWEALDLAYTLAKKGGPDFRFALGQAVERMEGTWRLQKPVGPGGDERDTNVYPTQNATALLLFDRSAQPPRVLVHLLREDGSPERDPFAIPLTAERQMDRLVQVQIGANLNAGTGRDREHWAILVMRGRNGSGFEVATWTLSGNLSLPSDVLVGATPDFLGEFSDISTVRVHPGGQRAVFSAIDYLTLSSKVFELQLGPPVGTRKVNVIDRTDTTETAKEPRCGRADPDCLSNRTVVAVAYAGNDQLVNGRLNGRVYCDAKKVVEPLQIKDRPDRSPVAQIATDLKGPDFAFSNLSGAVFAASCTNEEGQAAYRFLFDGNSASLKWTTPVSTFNEERPLVSYQDTDKQLRCFFKKNVRPLEWSWYLCNASHGLAAAVIHPTGMQTSVEQNDVSLVRSFPVEGRSLSADKEIRVAAAGKTAIQWPVGKNIAIADPSLKGGYESPWSLNDARRLLEAKPEKRRVEWASLSGDGNWVAWIELRRTMDNMEFLAKPVDRPDLQQTVRVLRTMKADGTNATIPKQEGRALAVAVSDTGLVAHLQAAENDKHPHLRIGQKTHKLPIRVGEPACLAFSANGNYVVLGTRAGVLHRFETAESDSVREKSLVRPGADPDDPASYHSISACTVSDSGEIFVGYLDGLVWMFAADLQTRVNLTQRAVHRFAAPIKQINLSSQGRLAVLGDWQINNCSSAGLPGQTLRAWDLSMPNGFQPVSDTCFPNEVISGLGTWSDPHDGDREIAVCEDTRTPVASKSVGASAAVKSPSVTRASKDEVRICLMRPEKSRWHACPACSTKTRPAPQQVHDHVLKDAMGKGARLIPDERLESLYGIKP